MSAKGRAKLKMEKRYKAKAMMRRVVGIGHLLFSGRWRILGQGAREWRIAEGGGDAFSRA